MSFYRPVSIRPLPPGWRWLSIVDTSAPLSMGEPLPIHWTAANDELQITSTDPWSHAAVGSAQGWAT